MPQFSDRFIKSLKPDTKRYIVTEDSVQRGGGRFQVRVYTSGKVQFQIQYFLNGSKKQMSIGDYGTLSLAEARKEFVRLSAMVQQGVDPKLEKARLEMEEAIKQKARDRSSSGLRTFKELWCEYIASIQPATKPQNLKQVNWMYASDIEPFIPDDLLAKDFTQDHARAILKRVIDRDAMFKANNLHGRLKSCFRYGTNIDNAPSRFGEPLLYAIERNPISEIPLPVPAGSNASSRTLTEDEVRILWNLPREKMKNRVHHAYFKLALSLAGQRVGEVYHSRHVEWDLNNCLLEVPVERIKVKRRGSHVVPLEPLSIQLYKEITIMTGHGEFLFPHRDHEDRPASMNGLIQCCHAYTAEFEDIQPFTPRDIRRTCKTLMSKCGIDRLSRDMLQQHDEIDTAAQKNYDKYDYLKEKREAMREWSAYLSGIVG